MDKSSQAINHIVYDTSISVFLQSQPFLSYYVTNDSSHFVLL